MESEWQNTNQQGREVRTSNQGKKASAASRHGKLELASKGNENQQARGEKTCKHWN